MIIGITNYVLLMIVPPLIFFMIEDKIEFLRENTIVSMIICLLGLSLANILYSVKMVAISEIKVNSYEK